MNTEHFKHQEACGELQIDYDLYCPGVDFSAPAAQSDFEVSARTFLKNYQEVIAENERFVNHADGLDYALAVSSGIIAGFIDSFFVGEWDFKTAKALSNREINDKVMSFAKKNGYTGDRLSGAISHLEDKFKLPGDDTWNGAGINVSAKSHHLDDPSHHPTLIGLLFSIINQFQAQAVYANRMGEIHVLPMEITPDGMLEGKTPAAKISAGIINWCFNVAKNRKGHLYSDMGGSKSTAGGGMGVPGTVMSTLKELSMLPGIRDTDLPQKLYAAYTKGIGSGKGQLDLKALNVLFQGADNKFDLRTENAIKHELKRQSIPVLINEVVVRTFYFVRHLIVEWKENRDLSQIKWKNVLPFNNGTITRMLTISTGTFTVIDLADAAVRSAAKSGGVPQAFVANFVLRVNFVGVGRFGIACTSELLMAVRRDRMELALSTAAVTHAALNTTRAEVTVQQLDEKGKRRIAELNKSTNRLKSLKF